MSSVLQPWVEKVPWKQQSILFSGLRGPDHAACPNIKRVSRWMRMVSQKNADPSKPYMDTGGGLPECEALNEELEFASCHFVHHFADALRVIALHHPDPAVKGYAWTLHEYVADEIFHFVPESDAVFLTRHRDKVGHD